MELISASNVEALQVSNHFESFTDESFEEIVKKLVFGLIQDPKSGRSFLVELCSSDVDPGFMKQTIPALISLLIEAAKSDASTEQLSLVLEDCQFSSKRKGIMLDLYMSHKQKLRSSLAMYETTPPHIIDADWRLDYNLRNNQLNRVMELSYTVALKTEQDMPTKENGDVQFSCTREQLQDFVGKLKEAVKAVEKASQS